MVSFRQHGPAPLRSLTYWTTTSRRTEDCSIELLIRQTVEREMDFENRRHRQCQPSFLCHKWTAYSNLNQTRFVPGSVENIQKGLEWAGLNYDYGLLSNYSALYSSFGTRFYCRPWSRWTTRSIFSSTVSLSEYNR